MTVSSNVDVKIRVGGEELSEWQSYSIESDLLTPADAFSFRAANHKGELTGLLSSGMTAEVEIDGEIQITGHVDEIEETADSSGAFVQITGRDLFHYLLDVSATPKTLHNKTLLTLAQYLSEGVIDTWETSTTITLPVIPTIKIEPGESKMDVLNKYAKKAKVLIWCKPDGTGVIDRPTYNQSALFFLRRYVTDSARKQENNIISGGVRDVISGRHSSITALATSANLKAIYGKGAKYKGEVEDDTFPLTKPWIMSDGQAKNTTEARDAATLKMQEDIFEGWQANYTVKGHYNTDRLWQIDNLCDVYDECSSAKGVYYIVKRRFYDDGNGKFTDVSLRKKDIYLP